jgi:hypothetical protein
MKSTKEITKNIKSLFKGVKKPADILPLALMACSLAKRPGLSALGSAATVIAGQSEFGAPTSARFVDGTPNCMNHLIMSLFSEIYRAVTQDMVVNVVIGEGELTSIGTGANGAGTVITTSRNIIGRAMGGAI